MARYKDVAYAQLRMIPIDFNEQILSGTFEYTLNDLIDRKIDRSLFDVLDKFLESEQPKQGKRGKEIQSNVTDNESAKMKSSHGMIQVTCICFGFEF